MLSTSNIGKLIAEKRREIEKEKIVLGLSPPQAPAYENDNESRETQNNVRKEVNFAKTSFVCDRNDFSEKQKEKDFQETSHEDTDERIPPELERYIRRYIGLPVMLKAGEYSPNNPLVRAERAPGDALLGLGEYERRRNTLRKIQQQQYREYLDQQAKKKQEAKQQAERERREREQKEREREERERELLEERERHNVERRRSVQRVPDVTGYLVNRVDTGVQVDSYSRPLSVAVQTDETELFRMSPSPCKSQLTTAERELSPRSVHEAARAWPPPAGCRPDARLTDARPHDARLTDARPHDARLTDARPHDARLTDARPHDARLTDARPHDARLTDARPHDARLTDARPTDTRPTDARAGRRRSYGDFDERTSTLVKKSNRDKLSSDLRHTYMPSIFDADAIEMRNLQAEKEAAERRRFYQQELKNQILEQQRIREERKTREKLLEQAEMRRLEEQLRMLRVAQERELGRQHDMTAAMKDHATDYNDKRIDLQRDIDNEQQKLLRAKSQPYKMQYQRNTNTSKSETNHSKLPFYYPRVQERTNEITKKPYSINIPDNSIFSANYDVDSYLRKNLNFNKDKATNYDNDDEVEYPESRVVDEKSLIHHRPEVYEPDRPNDRTGEPSKTRDNVDTLPIPVLRHSPKRQKEEIEESRMSEAMKKVDDKWKVPVVQKNILKALPNDEGKSVNILTQLGSIRRQLQLEQLKLDKMIIKESV